VRRPWNEVYRDEMSDSPSPATPAIHGSLPDPEPAAVEPRGPSGRVLVLGWFSFPAEGATAGDLMARAGAWGWLADTGREYDIACAEPFGGGVDWRAVDPLRYSTLLFVCGPYVAEELQVVRERFPGCELIGLNVSILRPNEDLTVFDLLLERDS